MSLNKAQAFMAITESILAGVGINSDSLLPAHLRNIEKKEPEKCLNEGCDKPRNGKKMCCSAECFKEFKRQQNENKIP